MSQRRSSLLPAYCCRRLTAMNLSNAEVNGIHARKLKSPTRGAKFDQKMSTYATTKGSANKKPVVKVSRKAIHVFWRLLNEAEAVDDQGADGTAESLYNQLFHFCKRRLSAKRHEAAIPYNQLALLQFRRGRLDLAKNLFDKSLEILVRTLGANHRHTRIVRANLQDLLHKIARGPSSLE